MVPLLSLFFSPVEFLPAYHIFAPICMLVLALESRQHIQSRILLKILVMALIGIPLGTIAIKHLPTETVSLGIAVLTLTFAGYLLLNKDIRIGQNSVVELIVGFCSGSLNSCTTMSDPPVVIYGLAQKWNKDVFRSTLLAYFSLLSPITPVSFFAMDMVTVNSWANAGAAILPALAVGHFGIRLKNRVNETLFRRVVLVVIMYLGIMGAVSYFMKSFG